MIPYCIIQWVWCSMSTRNSIDFDHNPAHPLLDNRWIMHEAVTHCSGLFKTRKLVLVHCVLHATFVRKRNLRNMMDST